MSTGRRLAPRHRAGERPTLVWRFPLMMFLTQSKHRPALRLAALAAFAAALFIPSVARAGEANLVLPDVGSETFMGMSGKNLLTIGLLVSLLGMGFGIWIYTQ